MEQRPELGGDNPMDGHLSGRGHAPSISAKRGGIRLESIENEVSTMPVRGVSSSFPTTLPGSSDGGSTNYTVKAGDTLWAIARRFGFDLQQLLEANPLLSDPNRIRPGQVLQMPSGSSRPPSVPEAGGVVADDTFAHGAAATAVAIDRQALSPVDPSSSPAAGSGAAMSSAEVTARQLAPARTVPSAILRAVDTEAFRQASSPHAVGQTVRLGDMGEARVSLHSQVAPGAATEARAAFEGEARGRNERALFATTRGGLDWKSPSSSAVRLPAFEGGMGFTLDRPYVLTGGGSQTTKLATAMVRGSTDGLPLSAKNALALPPTSRFTLDGYAAATPTAEGSAGRTAARAEVAASVEVERGQGSQVTVTLTRRAGLEGAASTAPLASGRTGVALQGAREASDSTAASYTLDLDTPAGRRAYESLLAFRTTTADALVDGKAPGVVRGDVRQGFVRAQTVGGQARVASGDASVDVGRSQSQRVERDLAGAERRQTSASTSAAVSAPTGGVVLGLGGSTSGTTEVRVPAGFESASRELPRSASAALALPEGATWRLSSDRRAGASARQGDAADGHANREQSLTVDVARGAGSTVFVDASWNQSRDASAGQRSAAANGRVGIELEAGEEKSRARVIRATLDLAKTEHASAYESLLRGDPKATTAIARAQETLTDETRAARHARATATLPDTSAVSGTGTLSWRREVTTQGVEGTRVEQGSLSAAAELTMPVRGATVGFSPGQSHAYELSLPAGAKADVALPTDATKAQELPLGSRFTLQGDGRLGASVAVGSLKVGASESGKVRVDVFRGDGDTVELRARVTQERTNSAAESVQLGRSGQPQVQLTGSHRSRAETGHDLSVSLDLSKPEHRAAYDAALRGDIALARQVGAERQREPARIDERTRTDVAGAAVKNLAGMTVDGSISREILPSSDVRIFLDDDRRAASRALENNGAPVQWQEIRARGALGGDFKKEVPLETGAAGANNLGLGFSTGKAVSVRVLTPVTDDRSPKLSLPTAAAEALALPRGTEVEFTGEGTLGSSVKAVMGGPLAAATGVVLAGTISAGTSRTTTDRFSVTVQRGEGNSSTVSLNDAKVQNRDNELGVRVGLTVDPTAVLGAGVTSSLPALAQKPLEGALGKVAEAVNDKASVALTQTTSRRRSEEQGLEIRFDDLTKPEAAAAYAEAVQGRPEAALALAERARGGEKTGVQMVRGLETTSSSHERKTHLTAGGGVLYLREALRQDKTQIVHDADGTSVRNESTYQERSRNVLGGRKEMLWEAVSVRTTDNPQGQRFYRMTFDQKDPMTSRTDVARVQRMAENLGALPARPVRAEAKSGVASVLGAAMGKTRTEVEVFVTPKGMDKIRGASNEQALTAYGQSVAVAEGEKQAPPWARAEDASKARAILEDYERLRNEPRGGDTNDPSERARLDYRFAFKRNIWDDTDNYKRAKAFASSVDHMRSSTDPVEWNKAFANMGKGTGFQVAGALGAMNALAGADEVLVHRLKMSGSRVDLEMTDEGLLSKPVTRELPADPNVNGSAF